MIDYDAIDNMTERQIHAILIQREIAKLPAGSAFEQSFIPANRAVKLLAEIAASSTAFAPIARDVLDEWRAGLATPDQVAAVKTGPELDVYTGAVVSPSDEGYWILTWTWRNNT
jgi:hypothetical protein